ncbi:hypothetical protein [Altererythrobacter sp. GH1-8]|uniref:hypothetical protein n=1 Tax=Altererythrobacter sp. GH1-8 TaxID=3349333 RepID=UPI00374CCB38
MSSRNYSLKSGLYMAVPLALVLLVLAAPVSGQDTPEADNTGAETTSSAAAGASTASQQPAQIRPKDELQVTGERIRQPLPEPDMQTRMPRIYLSDMQPWNWNGMWHASEWANGDSTIPWKYGQVRQAFGGDTHFVLTPGGAPELKAQKGHPEWINAMYEVDVTIPDMRPGLIASPIWLYNDRTQESIAVQIIGKRHMQLTINGAPDGVRKSEEFRLPGDYSGRRMKLAIRRHADLGLIDVFVDGELVYGFNEESPAFPKSAMRPVISLYAADKHGWAKQWAGTWEPLTSDERIRMTVHGYRATPL